MAEQQGLEPTAGKRRTASSPIRPPPACRCPQTIPRTPRPLAVAAAASAGCPSFVPIALHCAPACKPLRLSSPLCACTAVLLPNTLLLSIAFDWWPPQQPIQRPCRAVKGTALTNGSHRVHQFVQALGRGRPRDLQRQDTGHQRSDGLLQKHTVLLKCRNFQAPGCARLNRPSQLSVQLGDAHGHHPLSAAAARGSALASEGAASNLSAARPTASRLRFEGDLRSRAWLPGSGCAGAEPGWRAVEMAGQVTMLGHSVEHRPLLMPSCCPACRALPAAASPPKGCGAEAPGRVEHRLLHMIQQQCVVPARAHGGRQDGGGHIAKELRLQGTPLCCMGRGLASAACTLPGRD